MTDTRRKHIRKRKQANKIRRFCRWNHITVEEYWQMKLYESFGFTDYRQLLKDIQAFTDNFNEMVNGMKESIQRFAHDLGDAFIEQGKTMKGWSCIDDDNECVMLDDHNDFRCSKCNADITCEFPYSLREQLPEYCPKCGAKIRKWEDYER